MRANRLTASVAATIAILVAGSTAQAQVKVVSGGDVTNITQKNVVDHMIVGDSIEVEAAQLAVSRTQNAAVRDFANMLITDHRGHLDNLRKLAGKKDIGREANSADTSATFAIKLLTDMKAMSGGADFDKMFIQQQIAHHEYDIAIIKTLRPAATDDDLQKDIDRTLPVLERHLSRAKEVAAQLASPPGSE